VKRILILGIAAVVLAVGVPALAGAAGDAKGPSCADIIDGSGSFSSTGSVTVLIDLAAPSCRQSQVTYEVFANTAEGLVSLSFVEAADADTLVFSGTVNPTTNSSICISAKSSIANHTIDQAPDSSCYPLPREGSSGFGGFS
jgi:hypothetical protein